MSHYKLDISKWRCGGNRGTDLITGLYTDQDTLMINEQGNMCCLGQFSIQFGADPKNAPKPTATPAGLAPTFGLYDENFILQIGSGYSNKDYTMSLMTINDNKDSTIEQKVESITSVLSAHGHTLNVIGWDWLAEQRKQSRVTL